MAMCDEWLKVGVGVVVLSSCVCVVVVFRLRNVNAIVRLHKRFDSNGCRHWRIPRI